ncbi:MAG: hypothetical protein KDA32_10935 [Phycisphaerales bacterium]|nr:hypothetical protein [Phycisphaerales bacterium]
MIEVTVKAANGVEAAIIAAGGVSELGRRMGVSRQSIRNWRVLKKFPTDEWVRKAHKATKLPEEVLAL